MRGKIYPNDPCPCGSGRKFKNCCGKVNSINLSDYTRSDLQMVDFVKEQLYEDIDFLTSAINIILGFKGYEYCSKHSGKIDQQYKNDKKMVELVQEDELGVYQFVSELENEGMAKKTIPYGGGAPEEQGDILSLDKKGYISKSGHQVELFHAYLMFHLNKRFDEYFYFPGEKWIKNQHYGPLAHRGFDFLLAITLYLELQLGVHVYLDKLKFYNWTDSGKKDVIEYFGIQSYKIPNGMSYFLQGYKDVLIEIDKRYSILAELQAYNGIDAYESNEYEEFIKMWGNRKLKYIQYLRYLIPTIIFQDDNLCLADLSYFPQCDYLKYAVGLDDIHKLFEEKVGDTHYNPGQFKQAINDFKKYTSENNIVVDNLDVTNKGVGNYDVSNEQFYHKTVFLMMDELNGRQTSVMPEWAYVDNPPNIDGPEWNEGTGLASINPARKSSRLNEEKIRKLRMEIYDMINGKMFEFLGPKGTNVKNMTGRYPILPWLSKGNEDTAHVRQSNGLWTYKDVFSENIESRQQSLNMEIRLTEIPVNCIEEFLNPDIYYTWYKQQQLNDRLQKQINLNYELVRNFTHSSVNYLNPDKLAKTGVELQEADAECPGVDELHTDGHSLILQSVQEAYVTRQLNTLVRRCNSDLDYLAERIRSGLADKDGVSVYDPIGFAVKSLLARILYRGDQRSGSIRDKLKKDEKEWQDVRNSFMHNILATDKLDWKSIKDWWQNNIGGLEINLSEKWNELHIIPDEDFYDLIVEIITEQLLNALSHGDLSKGICIEFGQEEKLGRINWAYITCENTIGVKYGDGSEEGIKTINETLLMLNNEERGLDTKKDNGIFYSTAWIQGIYLIEIKKD